jgi:hypothetical protein
MTSAGELLLVKAPADGATVGILQPAASSSHRGMLGVVVLPQTDRALRHEQTVGAPETAPDL